MENLPSTIPLIKQIEDYVSLNHQKLVQQISNLNEIIEIFSNYPYENEFLEKITKLKVALATLEINLLEVISPRSGKSELLILGDKIKLVYYLHIFYMLHYANVLKSSGISYQPSRENWIKITNTWQKYHRLWLGVRRNPNTKNISEAMMRVCQPSLEGLT